MNKVIIAGKLVAHGHDSISECGSDVHQVTIRTFEPYLSGSGHEEFHPVFFFGEQARQARRIAEGNAVLILAAIRWSTPPCLHAHHFEML